MNCVFKKSLICFHGWLKLLLVSGQFPVSFPFLWFLPALLIFLCALFCWWIFLTWLQLPHNLKWFFFREDIKCPFPQNSIDFCVTRLARGLAFRWLKVWIYLTATWMRCKNCEFRWRPKTRGLFLHKLLVFKGIVWVCKFMGFKRQLARMFLRY